MKKLLLSDYCFKKISLLITLFVAISWHASAQINIGSGSATGNSIPVEPFYDYTYSQSIYLASEIGASGNITGIKYFAAAGTSISNSNDWTVYIGHTTKTSFSGSTDWVASASLTQVHAGIVTLVGGEVTITFSSPFYYNGFSNLIIAVDENSPSFDFNSDEFLGSAVANARSIRYRFGFTNPNPSSPPTATGTISYIPNIQLIGITQACATPSAQTATSVTATTATLGWTENGSATTWDIEWGTTGFTQGSGTWVGGTTTNPYSLSGLAANTAYDFYVRSDCGGLGNSIWVGPFSFTTFCAYSIPLYEGFESGYSDQVSVAGCLSQENISGYSSSDVWIANSSLTNHNRGARTGSFNAYLRHGNEDWIFIPVTLVSGTSYTVELYARQDDSVTSHANISISYGSTHTSVGMVNTIAAPVGIDDSYQLIHGRFTPSSSGLFYIGIKGYIDFFPYSISIDDISVFETPACIPPYLHLLTASNITGTTASLGWTEEGSATTWDIEWGTTGFTQGAGTMVTGTTTNPHSLSGLTGSTMYDFYVRADCGGSGTSTWAGPFSFTTACTVSFPYTENFDGSLSNGVWSCWTVHNVDGNFFTWSQSNQYISPTHSGSYAAHGMGNNDDYLISPELTVGATALRIKFWDKVEYSYRNNTYTIKVSTTGTDPADFTNTITTIDCSNTSWLEHIVDLSAFTNQTIYVAFHQTYSGSPVTGFGIDDFTVEEMPSCMAPTVQTATSITPTTASLGWTENGSATTWDIEWSTTGFTQGAGTMVTGTTTNPHSLSGLTGNTAYDFYVRADCGGLTSTWVGPFSFTTTCAVMSAPFSESFDATSLPSCWSQSATSGGPWTFGNPSGGFTWSNLGCAAPTEHSGNSGNMAAMDFSGTDAGVILELPVVDVSSLSTPYLSFWYFLCASGYSPVNQLYVEAWNGSTWTLVGSNTTGTSGWEKQGFNISAHTYSTSLARVRLRVESGGSSSDWYGDAGIDDVSIVEAPSCLDPTVQTATSITATTASLGWTENGSATTWDIEWSTTGFSQGAGTMVTGTTTNPHSLTGLTANTAYDFYVRADCGGSGTSAWVGPYSFTTLCNPYSIPLSEGFESGYTNQASVAGCLSQESVTGSQTWIANSSLTNYNRGARTGSFNAYLSSGNEDWIFIPVTLVGGTSYTTEVYARQDGSNTSNANVSISYGSTNTSAGMVNTIAAPVGINNSYQLIFGRFTPSSSGVFYIGVKGFMNGFPWYISIDDISVFESPACLPPSVLTATSITPTAASLGWTENGSATTWDIEWSTTGFTQGAGTMVTGTTTNPYSLTGLTANTAYDYYVRADCGGSSTSTWAGPFSFTTLPPTHTLPVTEDFEAGFSNFDIALGNDVDWVSSTSLYHSGTKSAYNGYSVNNENIIHETGILDLSTAFSPIIEFWHIAKTEGTYDKCYVEISTDGGSTYTALPISAYDGASTNYSSRGYFHEDSYSQWGTSTQTPTNSWWKKETFSLTGFKVANVRLRFRLTSDVSANRDGWYIDDITIKDLSTDDIVITEYARNTTSGNSYLELFNALDVDIDLSGTKIVCSGANSTVIDLGTDVSGSVVVPAGGFLVLASNASQATFETAWSTTLGINVTYNNTGLSEFANNNTFALKIGGTANTNNGTLINQSTATVASGNRIFQLPLGNWAGNNDVAANRATPGSFLNFTDYNQVKFAFTNGVWKSATGYAHSSPNGSTGDAAAVIVSGSASFIDGAILDKLYIWPTGGTSISSQNVTVNTSIKISHKGSLAITGSGAVTCANEISVEKKGYSSTNDYNAWSTPLATGIDFSSVFTSHNPCDFYVFKASDQSWRLDYTLGSSINCGNGLVTVTAASIIASPEGNADGKFDVARGYFIVGNASNSSYNFSVSSSGALNNGTITANIYGSSGVIVSGSNDWNLIGNPYPSALSINGFLTANSSVIANALYLYNPGTGMSTTASYTALNSTDLTSIASCQGFYVDASTATNGLIGTASFTNSMRTNQNSNFRSFNSFTGIYLTVTNSNLVSDQTRLYFDEECQDGKDRKYDAVKMENSGFNFASLIDGDKMVFNGLKELDTKTKIIPLYFQTNEQSLYTITIDSLLGYLSNKDIILEDKFMKKFHDLKNQDYVFSSDAKEWSNRFFLHIVERKANNNTGSGTVTAVENIETNTVSVINFQNDIFVTTNTKNSRLLTVELLNMNGQLIKKAAPNASSFMISTSKLSAGIYLIKTQLTGGQVAINKVVVR